MRWFRGWSILAIVLATQFSTARAGQFTPLGDLAGGAYYSVAAGISDDGKVVVGGSAIGGAHPFVTQAFRWEAGVMTPLGTVDPQTSNGSAAHATSANGQVIVGSQFNTNNQPSAFRWEAGVMNSLPLLAGQTSSQASAISPDGLTIVGYGAVPGNAQALRWQGGVPLGLGKIPAISNFTAATAVSADGSIVAGSANPATSIQQAFQWQAGTISSLPGIPNQSSANGISADGSVIVGAANPGSANLAIRWEAGVTTVLGDFAGGTSNSSAFAVTADGNTIVGMGTTAWGPEAFIWDAQHGMRLLQDVLTNEYGLGAALSGWHLTEARDITADGRSIVGVGLNPNGDYEGWIFTVPEPSSVWLAIASLVCLAAWKGQRRGALRLAHRPTAR